MKKFLFVFLVWGISLQADLVDIITFFPITDFLEDNSEAEKAGFEIHSHSLESYTQTLLSDPYRLSSHKVLVWNYIVNQDSPLFQLPREKLLFFLFEPWPIEPSYYDNFSRVYTWDDTLVDNVKFFKLYYPHLMPMRKTLPSFKEKKLCTMVFSNCTDERKKIVTFFESKPEGEFEFYGYHPYPSKLYKGPIPGWHSGDAKRDVLARYRFCVCFENATHLSGYITEKIFNCFAAGCIPIYWGASNIEEYIPKNCFIDYRDFSNNEEMYQFIKKMPAARYNKYIDNIRTFLASQKAQCFSREAFDHLIYQGIIEKDELDFVHL